MSSAHLVLRLRDMADAVPRPRIGEWNVPALFIEAAEEIETLRKYAILLESINPASPKIEQARQDTQVNWMAVHGVSP